MSTIDTEKIKSDSDVGELLEMFFARDPNFSNELVDRFSGNIYYNDIQVYAEVGQYDRGLIPLFKRSLESKTSQWGDGFKWDIKFIHSVKTLYLNWCTLNLDFINTNIDQYLDIFYNSNDTLNETLETYFFSYLDRCKSLAPDCDRLYELIKKVLECYIEIESPDKLYSKVDDLVRNFGESPF